MKIVNSTDPLADPSSDLELVYFRERVVYLLVFSISISRTVSLDLQLAILWCPCNRTSSNVNKRTEYFLINRKL